MTQGNDAAERHSRNEAIRMAILAALMHHKPDYRSPARLDQAAKVIGEFVIGALDDLGAEEQSR